LQNASSDSKRRRIGQIQSDDAIDPVGLELRDRCLKFAIHAADLRGVNCDSPRLEASGNAPDESIESGPARGHNLVVQFDEKG